MSAGFGFVILLLLLGLIRNRQRPAAATARFRRSSERQSESGSVQLRPTADCARCVGCLCSCRSDCFRFHVYWAHYAAEHNEKFQELSYKDLRDRRLSESTLRGWILDRSGNWTNHWLTTGATPAATSVASIRWTKQWPNLRFGSRRSGTGARAVWRAERRAARGAGSGQRSERFEFKGNRMCA